MGIDFLDTSTLASCYHCGKCSSVCDVNRLDHSFQPHRLLHLVHTGLIEQVLSGIDIWRCTTCFSCSEVCPQGIGITEILWRLRASAFRSGNHPSFVADQRERLLRTGTLCAVSERDSRRRDAAQLPQVSPEPAPVSTIITTASERCGMR